MFCKERTQYLFLGIISTTQTYRKKKELFLILQNTHKIFYVKFILNSSLHAVDDVYKNLVLKKIFIDFR